MIHKPVLSKQVLSNISPSSGDTAIDATAGEGGHTIPISKAVMPGGKVLAIDRDPDQIERLKKNLKESEIDNVTCVRGNFKNLKEISDKEGFTKPTAILFDLGFSSTHIESSGRGFSFQKNEPLDMRYNPQNSEIPTAKEIVNSAPVEYLEKILEEYGEEPAAKPIASGIVKARKKHPIDTTGDLVNVISSIKRGGGKINPATKTFQALRISVNNEIQNIETGLDAALNTVGPKGKIAVITFHSLEDRLIKNLFKKWDTEGKGENLTKKVIKPHWEEVSGNPRARSAKLRIFKKI